MEVEDIARELIRALRGSRSQTSLSRRIGCTTNVLYAWESGRRQPELGLFLRLALRCKVDVAAALEHFFREDLGELSNRNAHTSTRVARLVAILVGGTPVAELARTAGLNRATITRWLAGESQPRLAPFLTLLQASSGRLLEFLELFVDPAAIPSVAASYADLQAQRAIAYEEPWSHAVLRALELESYRSAPRHRDGFIAAQIGISVEEEQRLLASLSEAGHIRFDGRHWRLLEIMTVDTRADAARALLLKKHWAEVGLERLEASPGAGPAYFSYNLFAVSEDDFQRIRALHLEYYERMRAIVAASTGVERVVLSNLQLMPLANRQTRY